MQSDTTLEARAASPPKLFDRVRQHLRVKHYSIRTEQAYLDWIRRFILFHGKRHPNEMGEQEISAFLTHLAVDRHVAASTQNQAFSALLFLYQQVLDRKLDFIDSVERVCRPPKLPVVFTPEEARAVLAHLKGDYRLMTELLYGSGPSPHGMRAVAHQRHRSATTGSPSATAKPCASAWRFCREKPSDPCANTCIG
jgi:integrase